MKTSWIVRVQVPGKLPMWVGSFQADGRKNAKREARLFVPKFLPLETKIISIAQGSIQVTLDGPEIPFDQ